MTCVTCSVIKIILQFCKENSLLDSLTAIQVDAATKLLNKPRSYSTQTAFCAKNECQVSLNTVESIENFVSDVNSGRWDQVLPIVSRLKLPQGKLESLYEQVRAKLLALDIATLSK